MLTANVASGVTANVELQSSQLQISELQVVHNKLAEIGLQMSQLQMV